MAHSADQILQIAMYIEQLGQSFYKSLSLCCDNNEVSAIAVRLAAEELKHFKTFETMRNSLPPNQKGFKMTEDQVIAAAGKSYKMVLPHPEDVHRVAIGGNIANALDLAVKMESDSIAYYKNSLSVLGTGADIIKAVIREEEKHLAQFQNYRKNITT